MNNKNEYYDSSKTYNRPIHYIVTTTICLVLAALIVIYEMKAFASDEKLPKEYLIAISDGCFVSGVIVGGLGALVLISGEGFFDLLAYGVGILLKSFSKNKNHESFIDYKQRKESERGNIKIWFVAVVGAAFILLGILFSAISSNMGSIF